MERCLLAFSLQVREVQDMLLIEDTEQASHQSEFKAMPWIESEHVSVHLHRNYVTMSLLKSLVFSLLPLDQRLWCHLCGFLSQHALWRQSV
eukprot:4639717-Amphidinium_carterae.1